MAAFGSPGCRSNISDGLSVRNSADWTPPFRSCASPAPPPMARETSFGPAPSAAGCRSRWPMSAALQEHGRYLQVNTSRLGGPSTADGPRCLPPPPAHLRTARQARSVVVWGWRRSTRSRRDSVTGPRRVVRQSIRPGPPGQTPAARFLAGGSRGGTRCRPPTPWVPPPPNSVLMLRPRWSC